jgi:acyl carrier protein
MDETREIIIKAFCDVCHEQAVAVPESLGDELVLLQSGLDSLGFAILVAELENRLGYDPFVLMEDPVYPKTMGEFVQMYQARPIPLRSIPS